MHCTSKLWQVLAPFGAWLAEFCLHMGFVLRTFTHDFIDICSKNFLIADLFDLRQIRHCNTAGISTVGVSFNVSTPSGPCMKAGCEYH